jgi:hypothetical protein
MSTARSLITLLLLGIALIVLIFLFGRKAEAPIVPDDVVATSTASSSLPAAVNGIPITDTYANGTHSYAFDLYLPSTCHRLSEPEVMVGKSLPERITITYTILPPEAGAVCAQVITRVPVTVPARAAENAILTSLFLGTTPLSFTIVSENN